MSTPLAGGQRTLTSFFSKGGGAAAAATTTKAVIGDPAVAAMNKRSASASIGAADGKRRMMSASSPTRAAAVSAEAANGGANGRAAAAAAAGKSQASTKATTLNAASAPAAAAAVDDAAPAPAPAPTAATATATSTPPLLLPPPPPLDRAAARAAASRACSVARAAWEEARAAGKPSPPLGALLVEPSWRAALARVVPGISDSTSSSSSASSPSALALQSFMEKEWAGSAASNVFPPPWLVFRALNEVPLDAARVVVIGQDPYHGPGQAEGLSFSVPRGQAIPPSLRNIHKELFDDGVSKSQRPGHGSLAKWAEQGVLLLNATLTVRRGQANSHQGKGWDAVTDAAVAALLKRERPAVFLLWGKFAEKKVQGAGCKPSLRNPRHVVLTAPHPSGLSASRGFFGCRHFSKCNDALREMGGEPVDWDLSTP